MKNLNLSLEKVKAHSQLLGNDRADELAKAGLSAAQALPLKYATYFEFPILLYDGLSIEGNLRSNLRLIMEEKHISMSHKQSTLVPLAKALSDDAFYSETIKNCLFETEKNYILKFDVRRFLGALPVKAKLREWYGERHDPSCRLCGETETQEHFFSCDRKAPLIATLLEKFTVLLRSYNRSAQVSLEEFCLFLTSGVILPEWLAKYCQSHSKEINIEMIRSLYSVISNDCHSCLWRGHTLRG